MYGKIDFVQIMNGGEFIPCYFNNDLLIKNKYLYMPIFTVMSRSGANNRK